MQRLLILILFVTGAAHSSDVQNQLTIAYSPALRCLVPHEVQSGKDPVHIEWNNKSALLTSDGVELITQLKTAGVTHAGVVHSFAVTAPLFPAEGKLIPIASNTSLELAEPVKTPLWVSLLALAFSLDEKTIRSLSFEEALSSLAKPSTQTIHPDDVYVILTYHHAFPTTTHTPATPMWRHCAAAIAAVCNKWVFIKTEIGDII